MVTDVFIDMDSVIADFVNSPALNGEGKGRGYGNYPEMYEIGFFENLPVVEGALSAVREIVKMFPGHVHILTQPVENTHYSYSEKAAWIMKWFPELKGNLNLSQHKQYLSAVGRVLIDDNFEKWSEKWEAHGGDFIWFNDKDENPKRQWSQIIATLKEMKDRGLIKRADHVNITSLENFPDFQKHMEAIEEDSKKLKSHN